MHNVSKWLVRFVLGLLVAVPVGVVSAQTIAAQRLRQSTAIAPFAAEQQVMSSSKGEMGEQAQSMEAGKVSEKAEVGEKIEVGQASTVGEKPELGEQTQTGESGQVGEKTQLGEQGQSAGSGQSESGGD